MNWKDLLTLKESNKKQFALNAFFYTSYILMSVFILVYLQELIYRGFYDTLRWMLLHYKYFMMSYLLVLCVFLIITLVSRSLSLPFIIIGLFEITISTINYYVMSFKGDVVTFEDIHLLRETLEISNKYTFEITGLMYFSIFLLAFCFMVLYKIKIPRIDKLYTSIIISLLLLTILIQHSILEGKLPFIKKLDAIYIKTEAYEAKGLLLGMVDEIRPKIKPPNDYSEKAINNIIEPLNFSMSSIKPNIIFILNESFYDLNLVEGLELSEDPIPYFRKLTAEFSSANLLTSAYGGGTSQTEYEVITGFPVSATDARFGYTELIDRETPSIVSYLNTKGYNTLAIHPNTKYFYNRDNVYDFFGFEKKIFLEDMISPKLERNYISDRYTYDLLISEFEAKGDSPLFMWIVTIQNHGGYDFVYNKHGIRVLNNNLSLKNTTSLTNVANAHKESDNSLMYLIEYFDKVDEPTIIVFYGDHSPNLKMYYENTGIEMDYIDAYTTPFVIWNNFGLPLVEHGFINAYMAPSIVLHSIGFQDNYYFNKINEKKLPIGVNGLYLKDGKWVPEEELSQEQIDAKNELWLLQYDIQFGEFYGKQFERMSK